jgi:hypothetical protein
MIPRTLESAIRKAMKSFPALLVTGPRQSGKTTLLTERFSKSHRFVSLENPDVRARVEGIKATATVLPGHTDALNGWRALVGDRAAEGIIVSMAPEPFNVKTCHGRWHCATCDLAQL